MLWGHRDIPSLFPVPKTELKPLELPDSCAKSSRFNKAALATLTVPGQAGTEPSDGTEPFLTWGMGAVSRSWNCRSLPSIKRLKKLFSLVSAQF